MLKTLLMVIAAALAALLLFAATRPDSFRVERSLRIQAPPERLHALINDLHGFNTWNPYRRKDPGIKESYGGSASGPGAHYAWESGTVGNGSMTITASEPTRVTMKLDFLKPFEAHNMAEFTLRPEGAGATEVRWAMSGPTNFVSKLMQVFFSFDTMIGKDFEDGLANLKTIAEAK